MVRRTNAMKSLAVGIRTQDAEVLVLRVVEPIGASPQMAPGWGPDLAEIRKEAYKEADDSIGCSAESLREAGFKRRTKI
jgi:hypothetical protein